MWRVFFIGETKMEIAQKVWDASKAYVAKWPGAAVIAIFLGPLLVWIF